MAKIKDKKAHNVVMKRIEKIMGHVGEYSPETGPLVRELDLHTELAEEYENEYYPIAAPSSLMLSNCGCTS